MSAVQAFCLHAYHAPHPAPLPLHITLYRQCCLLMKFSCDVATLLHYVRWPVRDLLYFRCGCGLRVRYGGAMVMRWNRCSHHLPGTGLLFSTTTSAIQGGQVTSSTMTYYRLRWNGILTR